MWSVWGLPIPIYPNWWLGRFGECDGGGGGGGGGGAAGAAGRAPAPDGGSPLFCLARPELVRQFSSANLLFTRICGMLRG